MGDIRYRRRLNKPASMEVIIFSPYYRWIWDNPPNGTNLSIALLVYDVNVGDLLTAFDVNLVATH